jgi:hypothetical protein
MVLLIEIHLDDTLGTSRRHDSRKAAGESDFCGVLECGLLLKTSLEGRVRPGICM